MADPGPAQHATPDELAVLYLKDRDVPCPGCAYNRRDGTQAACPECQEPVRVGEVHPERLAFARRHIRVIFATISLFSLITLAVYILHLTSTYQFIMGGASFTAMLPWFAIYAWGIVCSAGATMVARRGWAQARRPGSGAPHARTLIWAIALAFASMAPEALYELYALRHLLGF